MKLHRIFLQALATFVGVSHALTPEQWRTQSIYQVMTDRFARSDGSTTSCNDLSNYCGGSYKGLISKLNYIQNMGFTSIWISPVVKNIDAPTPYGSPYHGYHQTDLYNMNTNFGKSADLVAISDALHERGMYLMVDVVTNHMAQSADQDAVDYAKFEPFNKQSYFHPPCDINFNGRNATNLQQCWIPGAVAMADLRTEDSNVQSMFNTWIAQLVKNYTIDGLRIDSARQVDPASLNALQTAAGGMHVLGEMFEGDPTYFCPLQESISGLMNFPQYYLIVQAFGSTSGSMTGLRDGINQMKSTCKDVTLLGSFIENHDVARFANRTSDLALTRNALSFMMLSDGIPIVYQGQEQRFSGGVDPANREFLGSSGYLETSDLYVLTKTLNSIRSWAIKADSAYITYNAWPVYTDDQTIIMRKGYDSAQVIGIFTNRGAGSASATMTLSQSNSGFSASEVVMDVLACKTYTTDSKGNLGFTITNGEPIVLYPNAKLSGSGTCGQ